MSRSYKKTPISKDGGRSSKKEKQLSHKKFRTKEKQALKQIDKYPEEDIICPRKQNEALNSWEVNDSVHHCSLEDILNGPLSEIYTREELIELHRKWYLQK